jgi:hypothetical protein
MFDESELCAVENSHIVYIYILHAAAAVQMPRTRTREISNLTDNHLVILGGKLCAPSRALIVVVVVCIHAQQEQHQALLLLFVV